MRGEVSVQSIRGDVRNLGKMVATVKQLPARASRLLETAQKMLVDAPKNYAGPQVLHLPKKVELIKKAVAVLKQIPGTCKEVLTEGLALGRCTTGLASGSTVHCDTGKTAVAANRGKRQKLGTIWSDGSKRSSPKPVSPKKTMTMGDDVDPPKTMTMGDDVEPTETLKLDRALARGSKPRKTEGVKGTDGLPGGLLIKSTPPGATVRLDGRRLAGVTPLTVGDLSPGKHRIRLNQGVSSFRGTVLVEPDRYRTVQLELTRSLGRLEVLSTPPEAVIVLDGDEVGKTPKILRVQAGKHRLVVRLAGYVPVRRVVRLGSRRLRKKVRIAMRRAGEIRITSHAGAAVFIDGQQRGITPTVISVAPGRRVLRLELEGRVPLVRRVVVKVGKRVELALVMKLTAAERQRRQQLQQQTQQRAEARAREQAAAEVRQREAAEERRREARRRSEQQAHEGAEQQQRR